jgi:hypothetical protein
MVPDDQQKNDPTLKRPEQKDVLDGDYTVIASEDPPEEDEDDEGEDESGEGKKGGDRATLALDVPEPETALAAAEGPAPKEGKAKPGERKGKKAAAKSGDAKTIDVSVDEKAFGVEESASAETSAPETAQQEQSAFDRDEITDPEGERLDPLQMILGDVEKPWENEKLSAAEQKALNQVYRQNDPAAEEAQEAQETDPKAKRHKKSELENVAAATAIAAAAATLAAKKAAAEIKTQKEVKGPGISGISRGPRREAEQDHAQVKIEIAKPATTAPVVNNTGQIAPASNAEIAAVLGVGIATGANLNSASTFQQYDGKYNPNANADPASIDLFQQVMLETSTQPEFQMQPLDWSPDNPDANFFENLSTVYDGMNDDALTSVSLYRQSGWEDKRLEQKENSMDVTVAPEPKPDSAPAPEPAYNRDLQMNIGPGGP